MLGEAIEEIVSKQDESLEINPLKVYNEYINELEMNTGSVSDLPRDVTPDQAEENPEVRFVKIL